jgi:transposase
MQLKSILNVVEKHKGFVYQAITWDHAAAEKTLLVDVRERKKSMGCCSGCGVAGPVYDHLPARRFQFVPLWGILVFLVYAMRRIDCPRCGPTVEKVPWADGKRHVTKTYSWFLAEWAKRLSWKETAFVFKTSWETVFRCVEYAVEWGRARVDKSGVKAIGIDEIHWGCNSKFMTLVYQIDNHCKRLLWIGRDRTEESLSPFFRWFGAEETAALKFVCSDMWKPYLNVIRRYAGHAVNILDRFHIMSHFSKALDEVRAQEAKEMKKKGFEPVLKGTRWCILKRPENLTDKQKVTLAELIQFNLKSVRAYILKEEFNQFWEYSYRGCAAKFLDQWCVRAMRSKLNPIKRIAKMLRSHRDLIMNWFEASGEIALGAVEGLNNKAKVGTKLAYGFRTFEAHEIALYHRLGKLPVPETTHRFC